LTGRFVHNGRMATDNGWRLDDITTYWYWTVVDYVPKYWSIWILILLGIYLYLIRPSSFDSDLSSSSPSSSLNSRNLLNKKEGGPPSTIKESSESSQTLDDTESDKGDSAADSTQILSYSSSAL
uniref:PDR_assoc domain-containing protein n=1 Tax=Angiostrongylus cantonensis TaxID=6313 RepID=A0A0K0DPV7_ANGCA